MKGIKIFFVFLGLVLLSGCVDMSVSMKVNNDDTGNVTYIIGYNKETMEEYNMDTDEYLGNIDETWSAEGVSIENYNFDKDGVAYVGRKITFEFNSLEELNEKTATLGSEEEEESTTEEEALKFTRNGNEVTISLPIDEETAESAAMMASYISYTVSIQVEGKILENNADEVNGQTMTWNYVTIMTKGINATYDTSTSAGGYVVYIIIGVILVAGIVVVLKNVKKTKKK